MKKPTTQELEILSIIDTIEYVEGHHSDDLQYMLPLSLRAGAPSHYRSCGEMGEGGFYGR